MQNVQNKIENRRTAKNSRHIYVFMISCQKNHLEIYYYSVLISTYLPIYLMITYICHAIKLYRYHVSAYFDS